MDLKIKTKSKTDVIKYKNAKRMLLVHEEYPDFLDGLESANNWDNREQINKKFKKIIKHYKTTWYVCPKCKGNGYFSWSTGHGAYGEPETDSESCSYCNGSGEVSKKQHEKKLEEERNEALKEIKRLKKTLNK